MIFVQDVARGWRLAEELYEMEKTRAISLQYRYALIQSTLNSLDKNLSSELLAGLAQYGIWSADRVLRFIEAIEDEYNLSISLAATIPYQLENILERAVKLLDRLSKPSEKAKVLVRLSARKAQSFQRAYEEVQKIGDDTFEKAMLLIQLCRQNKLILEEAIRTARDIPNKYHQAIAIIELIPEDQNLV